MKKNKKHGFLGYGILVWPNSVRKSGKWAYVGLKTNDKAQHDIVFPDGFQGKRGKLKAILIHNRPAMAGPYKEFDELFPPLLEEGKSYLLGQGTIVKSKNLIGIRPKNPEQEEWMNGETLRSLYGNVVELWYEPYRKSEEWDGY